MSTATVLKRDSASRGVTNWSWLDSRHTFSFGRYIDRDWVQFDSLRVINDDRVGAGGGFDTHPHEDMEIITIVVDGALLHLDTNSVGGHHESTLRRGDVQIMSAGTGVRHSEFNGSQSEGLRFIQIWIEPRAMGLEPRYQERVGAAGGAGQARNELVTVVSPVEGDGAMDIYQDASISTAFLDAGAMVSRSLTHGKRFWVQVMEGEVAVSGESLVEGDGLGVEGADAIEIVASTESSVIVFELG